MNKLACLAVLAAGLLSGCADYRPPAYSYYQVPCPAGAVVVAAPPGTVTPSGTPPAPPPPPGTATGTVTPTPEQMATINTGATIQTNCVAAVPNYLGGYYYPGYYAGPPAYGSIFVGGRIR